MNYRHYRQRQIEGRVRIAVGFARLVIITLFAAQLGVLQLRADESAAPPRKLVYANTAAYKTTILGWAQAGATGTASGEIGDCQGFGYPYTIAPTGAIYVEDLASFLCGQPSFALLDAPTNIDTLSIVSSRLGSERSSFSVPPIGAVTDESPFNSPEPLVNLGDRHTYITTFAEESTPMRATIFGGVYLYLPMIEDFTAEPPVSQYAIQATGVYFVSVSIRPCQVGPCTVSAPVYGFASDGDSQGGTFRAFAFGQ